MKRVRHAGAGRDLTVDDVEPPSITPTQVLIGVEAIGVTLPAVRKLDAAAEPVPLAGEVCGTILKMGDRVTGRTPGELVTGLCFADAYAEQAVLEQAFTSPVPKGATALDAVALVRGGLVARGVLDAASLSPGESVLVTAAASGVGHLAVQLAKASGAVVVGAVSSQAKLGFVRELGADAACTYDDGPPFPVDAVLEGVGGELVGRSVKQLAPGGRLVFYGSGGGRIDAFDLLAGGRSAVGFQIARIAREYPERYAAWRDDLWRARLSQTITPVIDSTYPLEHAAAAHSRLLARENQGKVALIP